MSFYNLHTHDFVRVAVGVPRVHLADPNANADASIRLARAAARRGASVCVLPELGLTGYSCEDLFQQAALQRAAIEALERVVRATAELSLVLAVGLPFAVDGELFNVAAIVCRGRVLGLVPKTYLPNYREFYELRHFAPAAHARRSEVTLFGASVPFGADQVFVVEGQPKLVIGVELCEDLWTPLPPSSLAALAGATLILNLSASNATVGKSDYRRALVLGQSARCLVAYAYAGTGYGESTTDLAWDGHALIAENGTALAEGERFRREEQLVCADVDLGRLAADRERMTTFGATARRHFDEVARYRRVSVPLELGTEGELALERVYERFPFVPSDPATRAERCREVYRIQVQGLARRLEAAKSTKAVIGVSGGLDSTQALLIACRAMDSLSLPRKNVIAVTMPGFATSDRTLDQAHRLMAAFGVTASTIDIRPSCKQMLADIGHPYARGEQVYDTTFENVQAGERTSHLFRLANLHNAPVVGTGDLSELALGWCTYGVGDQMAHYNVNASVPKTLIQHLIRFEAASGELSAEASRALLDVLATEISPELVPGSKDGQPAQRTEEVVGPYELQDFHLYYVNRFGYAPSKVAFLCWNAWRDASRGSWPDVPAADRRAYDLAQVRRWLRVFLVRFFAQSQFKRSAMPNGPKVGSGGSLSPRGDWRAPSDSDATTWLAELDTHVPG
ncbi:MAG: NAD(+) synthase [Planctomycetota bacterium]|nr:NAD(+) synthase [Planctomycetota bacterium]